MAQGSVTHWVAALKQGDPQAAQAIWQRYCARLVRLARHKLKKGGRREADEEDVVQNAFHSFFRGVAGAKYPRLDDRDNLWRLLVVITARKALDQLRREQSQRQGGGTVQTEAGIYPVEADLEGPALQQVIGAEPSPAFAAQVAEQYRHLLRQLGEESLQQVAGWKLEGFTNQEIAAKLDVSLRTVARKLDAIRVIWQKETGDEAS
jgi:DNA-directed RNA polymerase specialized sigma24 family protein